MKNSLTAKIYREKMHREFVIKRMMQMFVCLAITAAIMFIFTTNAFAAVDPIESMNNLKNWIASFFEIVGVIVAIIGLVPLAMSFPSHDPSQRIGGILAIAAGVVLAGGTAIINYLINGN